ncbi:MAG: hypothetical protein IKJ73_12575 [Lachnospiraceae bacterium]|nr:hypothetical protein [Lachnospiraceae bacterium]
MRERIKKFIAIVMAIVVMNQLPSFDTLISYAVDIDSYTSITENSEDTYVLGSSGCTLDIASGVTVAEVEVNGDNTYTIENGGTVNSIAISNGTTNLNGGSYGTITTIQGPKGVGVIASGITANSIVANGPIQFNGNNTVVSLSGTGEMSGTVTVSDYLAVSGTDATINVNKDTVINASDTTVTVYYDGTAYNIPAGSTDTTILSEYGTRVSFGPVNSYVTWSSTDGKLDTPLWFGESIGTYQCIAAEGYYFPEGYTVTTTGNATPTVTRVDESEIQVSYTVANTDSGEVIITFPTPNELETGAGTLTIPDVEVGDTWEASVISDTNSTDHDGVMYKVKGTNDSTYTPQAPTAAGDYVARVILPATGIYKELTLTDEFNIAKRTGSGSVSAADVAAGEDMIIEITTDTHDKATAVIEYKVTGADDSAYSATAPTDVGNYTVRITLPESDTYKQLVLMDEFAITEIPQKEGAGTLTIADTFYGVGIEPQISSATNQTAGVVVEYKKYGANDATYSKKAPTATGKYVARVVLPENDNYNQLVLTDEFSISYLTVPQDAYSLVGQRGANGYYISDVTVVAGEGYAVSNSLDGEYVGQFTISSSVSSRTIYVMDVKTGAKSDGIAMAVVNIDRDTPLVDAEAGKTYYADSLAVSISDANLVSVMLNGENVDITGTNTILNLKSEGGVEEYEIVVTDRAGNVKNIKITVASEWTKTGAIPSGSPVKLEAGKNYTLGEGSWTVSGDATTYSGGSTFYIGSEGKYTFNKQ